MNLIFGLALIFVSSMSFADGVRAALPDPAAPGKAQTVTEEIHFVRKDIDGNEWSSAFATAKRNICIPVRPNDCKNINLTATEAYQTCLRAGEGWVLPSKEDWFTLIKSYGEKDYRDIYTKDEGGVFLGRVFTAQGVTDFEREFGPSKRGNYASSTIFDFRSGFGTDNYNMHLIPYEDIEKFAKIMAEGGGKFFDDDPDKFFLIQTGELQAVICIKKTLS